jgi:hypothetical protein
MAIQKCKECEGPISSSAAHCPHCGFVYAEAGIAVRVTDVDMHFGSMVGLMVMAGIAAIPAMILLFIFGAAVAIVLALFGVAIPFRH